MESKKRCEFLIIGAGIIGLTIARELIKRGCKDILIIEKEEDIGLHASGRNSGVLHAGIYYTPDTLKAKYSVRGNQLMKDFCREKGLTIIESGKVIVTRGPQDLEVLNELKRRADLAGAKTSIIDEKELKEIEPYAKTYEKALFSPNTAIVKPKEVLKSLQDEILNSKKSNILFKTSFIGLKSKNEAITSSGVIEFKKIINAAGAYADKIAHKFGIAKEYSILPFKGTYKKLVDSKAHLVRGNIYPVPDLRNPFLGVHFTKSADGEVYVGPTAIPVFGRENYGFFEGLSLESFSILYRDIVLLLVNQSFRENAFKEVRKYIKRLFYNEAKDLLSGILISDLEDTKKVGIRPQLIHRSTKKLVMDFLIIEHENTIHILNTISPAFTSSMAFAEDLVSYILKEGKEYAISVQKA